jgi:hypothetical protein
MTRTPLYLAVFSLLLGGCIVVDEKQRICEDRPAPVCVQADVKKPVQVLRHVVLLQFKAGTSAEDIRKIENAFSALPSRIPAIQGFEWGTDVSVENRQKGFTHCFVVSFRSEADRDKYASDPAHQEFGALLGPRLGDVLVIDYWAK